MVAVRPDMVGQPQIDHARLDHGVTVAVVYFEDALHARQGDDDAAADGQATARQAGAGAARQERHIQFVACAHNADDLLGGGGEDDDVGLVFFDGVAVAFVDQQIAGRGQHRVASDDLLHASGQGRGSDVGHSSEVTLAE